MIISEQEESVSSLEWTPLFSAAESVMSLPNGSTLGIRVFGRG